MFCVDLNSVAWYVANTLMNNDLSFKVTAYDRLTNHRQHENEFFCTPMPAIT